MSIRRSAGFPEPADDLSWASLSSAAAWARNQEQNINTTQTILFRLFSCSLNIILLKYFANKCNV
jgi:hypothetical protein